MESSNRIVFLDYLRAFVILLVVLDHVAQAYGLYSGSSWFVKDPTRDRIPYDPFHLVVDTFHMAFLFLLAGMFVMPSLNHRGILSFLKERLIKLGIPFVFGILVLVPPQTYYQYLQRQGPLDFTSYLGDHFFKVDWYYSSWLDRDYPQLTGDITSSGFWFLPFLMALTLVTILIVKLFPWVLNILGKSAQWIMDRPVRGYVTLSVLCFFLISGAEVFWGPRFSIMFWKIFWVRGNLWPLYILYFALGIGMYQRGYCTHDVLWLQKLSQQWVLWTLWTLLLALGYSWYCLTYYHQGAFSYDILLHFYQGGTWEDAWPLFQDLGPLIGIRTALHGFLATALSLTLLGIFYRFFNTKTPLGRSVVGASFGIYIFHEPLCVWMVYHLADTTLPTFLKFLMSGVGVYGLCWWGLNKGLLKIPMVRRIIG